MTIYVENYALYVPFLFILFSWAKTEKKIFFHILLSSMKQNIYSAHTHRTFTAASHDGKWQAARK